MKKVISAQSLLEFSDFLASNLGLNFSHKKIKDLERKILEITRLHEFKDVHSCMEWLKSEPISDRQAEVLTSYFTVGETYFFRDAASFRALKSFILPTLLERNMKYGKTLRIWSAGCSTGEEAYSIAMLLTSILKDIDKWKITILASDINLKSLKKLSEGIYGDWSFRETSPELKKRFFKKTSSKKYQLSSEIIDLVTPLYLNLADPCYPSLLNNTNAMDLIVCRNVLMYYVPKTADAVIQRFSQSVVNKGFLLLSAVEHQLMNCPYFHLESFQGASFYTKTDKITEKKIFALPTTVEDVQEPVIEIEEYEPEPTLVFPPVSIHSNPKPKKTTHNRDEFDFLASQGKLHDALIVIDAMISEDKLNEMNYYLKALILDEMGKCDEAIKELNKAIYINSDFALSYYTLGNIVYRLTKYLDAKKYFMIALSLLKNDPPEDIVPGSEGITVKHMIDIIESNELIKPNLEN